MAQSNSALMRERMATLEEKTKNIADDVGEIRRGLKGFIESADKKYASKSIETALYWFIGTFVVFVFGVIGSIITYYFTGGK